MHTYTVFTVYNRLHTETVGALRTSGVYTCRISYTLNLLYLAGTTLTAVTPLFIQILAHPSSVLVLWAGPIATVFIVAFGTRAFRNMMLATALDANRAHGLNRDLDLDTNAEASATFSDTMSKMCFVRPPPPLPSVVSSSRSTKTPLTPRLPMTGPSHPRTADSTHPGTANSTRRGLNTGMQVDPNTIVPELVYQGVGAQHVLAVEFGDIDFPAPPWTTRIVTPYSVLSSSAPSSWHVSDLHRPRLCIVSSAFPQERTLIYHLLRVARDSRNETLSVDLGRER
ncbi:hypothetical protein B0H10DRAFT_1944393 [Mycena sp. CBHHK59/15]|nr:hypothetical protein B0H10DRAFT_1944393 [Mycena sp. CBHHK59/15]